MRLIIVHHHFRPGGVRRVIELATPHLVAHWTEGIKHVVLATGETPDPVWLRTFRERLHGTPVEVVVEPAFGYLSELALDGPIIARRVESCFGKLVAAVGIDKCLVWAHNLGLGRNLYLSRELGKCCRNRCIPLLVHHHDWWFENRWHHFAAKREPGFQTLRAVAVAVFGVSRNICHAAINQADARVLEKHFPGKAGWLPNPVEPMKLPRAHRVKAVRSWLCERLGDAAPVWLLPCRLLRRKNIAEALLLTRWLRPEAWLATTGGVSSAEEQAYADTLADASKANGWRLSLGLLSGNESAKPSVQELLAASEAILLTSIQEGFGLAYLEAAAMRRPLLARELPNIAPDLAAFGFEFPQSYKEVFVDPALFDWPGERKRQARLFARWKGLMPCTASRYAGKPAMLDTGAQPSPMPFSRLTLTAQLEVLGQPVGQSWERCSPLNPFLSRWRQRALEGRLEASPWPKSAPRWLGGRAYAKRFLGLVPADESQAPQASASWKAQEEFLREKLRAENIYPLLWNSRT